MDYHCYICDQPLEYNDGVWAAFFEGEIVDPETALEWGGFQICEKCDVEVVVPRLRELRQAYRGPTIEMFPETLEEIYQ